MTKNRHTPAGWQNRIVGEGEEAPDQLLANPRNWRVHPAQQQEGLAAVLDKVGWVQRVIVNRRTGNLVDGHLRVTLAMRRNEATIPVTYVDLTEDEEALILATLDPLAGLAVTDKEMLKGLLDELPPSEDDGLQALLDGIAQHEGLLAGVEKMLDPTQGMDDSGDAEGLLKLKWGKYGVPMSQAEQEALDKLAEAYVAEHGALFGFAGWLMEGKRV